MLRCNAVWRAKDVPYTKLELKWAAVFDAVHKWHVYSGWCVFFCCFVSKAVLNVLGTNRCGSPEDVLQQCPAMPTRMDMFHGHHSCRSRASSYWDVGNDVFYYKNIVAPSWIHSLESVWSVEFFLHGFEWFGFGECVGQCVLTVKWVKTH